LHSSGASICATVLPAEGFDLGAETPEFLLARQGMVCAAPMPSHQSGRCRILDRNLTSGWFSSNTKQFCRSVTVCVVNGRVVRASERIVPCPRSYYFVCPESYLALPKLQHPLEWLREMAAASSRPDDAAALIIADPARVTASARGPPAAQGAPLSARRPRPRKVVR
jgi:hypothetical protein